MSGRKVGGQNLVTDGTGREIMTYIYIYVYEPKGRFPHRFGLTELYKSTKAQLSSVPINSIMYNNCKD